MYDSCIGEYCPSIVVLPADSGKDPMCVVGYSSPVAMCSVADASLGTTELQNDVGRVFKSCCTSPSAVKIDGDVKAPLMVDGMLKRDVGRLTIPATTLRLSMMLEALSAAKSASKL